MATEALKTASITSLDASPIVPLTTGDGAQGPVRAFPLLALQPHQPDVHLARLQHACSRSAASAARNSTFLDCM